MLSARAQLIAILLSAGFLLVVLELVRRHRLADRYAWLWLISGTALLVGSCVRGGIDWLGRSLGVYQSSTALLSMLLFAMLVLLLHLTVIVSRLSEQNTRLAQELGLLRADHEALAERIGPDPSPDA